MSEELSIVEYRCPGESYSISRAVHLSRLADFYAACRDCPRREETNGLSTRKVRRLTEIHSRPDGPSRFGVEGFCDIAINDFSPQTARAIAVEFARRVQRPVVFASDGRISTARIMAAIVEGIRWSGCEAIDIGAASAPCLTTAIKNLSADNAIYLGNSGGAAHMLSLKFWSGGKRIARGKLLDSIAASVRLHAVEPPADRPTRAYGHLRCINAADAYLDDLRPAYHALRPLKFVLRCTCDPVIAYLENLLRNVACRIIAAEPGGVLGGQVVAANAHFGVEIGDDGESLRLCDEQGHAVAAERLPEISSLPADALRTLTRLLVVLSRADLRLSAVLDKMV